VTEVAGRGRLWYDYDTMIDPTGHGPGQGGYFVGVLRAEADGSAVLPAGLCAALGIRAGDELIVLRGATPGQAIVQPAAALLPSWPGAPAATPGGGRVEPDATATPLAALPLFAGLPAATLARLARIARPRRYAAGETIVREGEPATAMYAIRSGLVAPFKTSPDGKEQILARLGPGEIFNQAPLFDGGPNPSSARAAEASEVIELRRDEFIPIAATDAPLALAVLQTLAVRLRGLTAVIEDLSFRQVSGRIARLLLDRADGRLPGGRLSQAEMGAMVGAAREVVGRALHGLEAAGAIRLERGQIKIVDRAKLEALL
jgi:CRP-like cAMP-binding protein